jgi:hypothetical protein
MAKRTRLNYDTHELTENLKHSSGKGVNALFSQLAPLAAAQVPEQTDPETGSTIPEAEALPHPPTPAKKAEPGRKKEIKKVSHQTSQKTSLQAGVGWHREDKILTELASPALTNHSYRYSLKELKFIRDIVYTAEVEYQTKLGKGEVLRIALLWLMNDFKERNNESFLVRVLTRKKVRK